MNHPSFPAAAAAALSALLLCACAPAAHSLRHGCPDTPISGYASAGTARIPLQGMLTERGGRYRLALATMNGMLLGGAEILPDGTFRVVHEAGSRGRRLLASAAEICLNYLDADHPRRGPWTSSGDGAATYTGDGITLTFRSIR